MTGPDARVSAGSGTCEVWWAVPAWASERHVALLDAVERARREQLRRQADRDRFTVACALLRLLVAARTGAPPERVPVVRSCTSCGRPHGKPAVPGSGLHVSVSHAGERVAVAVTQAGAVGVDVERVDPGLDVTAMARHVLSPAEAERLAAGTDRLTAFYTCWVRKESVLKATGDGLRVPMPTLTVSAPDQPARLIAATGRYADLPGRAAMRDLLRDGRADAGYVGAVTVLGAAPVLLCEHDAAAVLAG